ncbi:hypothetical protein H310_14881 [Aphanomyces invadans]|uniref:Core-binding (CB) domain-containing protein n=1 Tax=Aphanomyces invadans TaxID=157072 RepID=A0A024TAD5_9STRA|nr:hypothetical protein H310_14881 [Aphanomyces invadans]ETV90302.1 hypothetical protein H310_14881 [Aphanomyces invadans]|eukprot:XP_008881066.1 hypothetical protein H310_14881 [Aphanomyces invadans]
MTTLPPRESSTLEDIHGALVAERSKKAYASGIRQVVKWIQHTDQTNELLKDDGSINLATFSYESFVQFIVWTMQNTAVKANTMSGYRSVMQNYYKMQKVHLPPQFDSDLKDVFQVTAAAQITTLKAPLEIRRITASSEQTTSVKESEKRPLGFGASEALCRTTISSMDAGFLHLFLVLSWNLMARSKSTETIQLGHLSYEEDAIGVTFFKSTTKVEASGGILGTSMPTHYSHTCALSLLLGCTLPATRCLLLEHSFLVRLSARDSANA